MRTKEQIQESIEETNKQINTLNEFIEFSLKTDIEEDLKREINNKLKKEICWLESIKQEEEQALIFNDENGVV